MSNPRYGSGRTQFVGQGIEADLSKLDPAAYEGAVAYSEGELYYSNGTEWAVPQDEVDITRPRNQPPLTATQQAQLRLSLFQSPSGESQTGIIFEINADGVPSFIEGANVITRTVTSEIANLYDILYPDDGFAPGDLIWWRAKYLGTNGTQSAFSLPTAQIFPDLIETPEPVTRVGQIVGQVEVTAFESPAVFGLSYYETQTEFYNEAGDTLITTVTHVDGAITVLPDSATLPEGVSYSFRSRYGARVSVGSPVVYSDWSALRVFFAGGGAMLLEYNLDEAVARTVYLPLGVYDATGLDVDVNWGDGTIETFTTGGIKSHVYLEGVGPIVNVSISGTMRQFGSETVFSNSGLKRVDNWGQKLGLTSLRGACANAPAILEYVDGNIPLTVTSLRSMFWRQTGFNGDLSNFDLANVTDLSYMFYQATTPNGSFNNDSLSGWDTSNVTNMSYMFAGNRLGDQQNNFNGDISGWDVSKVTTFNNMFSRSSFNNDSLNTWVTGVPCTMEFMFYQTNAFNGAIGGMDTSFVTSLKGMFCDAYGFNKPIESWNVSNVTDMSQMFYTPSVSDSRIFPFNQPLNGWDVSSVTTMNSMFRANKTYPTSYSSFNQPLDNWDVSSVTDMGSMFAGAVFDQNIGSWDVSNVTNFRAMFGTDSGSDNAGLGAKFNNGGSPSINNWDTSSATDMSFMFGHTRVTNGVGNRFFNQPIGNWDVSNVTSFYFMFGGATVFDQDISAWQLRTGANLAGMFSKARAFNNGGSQGINNWNVTGSALATVSSTSSYWSYGMFSGAYVFNQPIGNWDVSTAFNGYLNGMFDAALAFSQDLSGWAVPPNASMSRFDIRAMSEGLYSKMLVGWANSAYDRSVTARTLQVTGLVYNNTDFSADFPDGPFADAVSARAFLVGSRSVVVSSAADPTADGTYLYNAATLTYDNSVSGWYFIRIGNTWELRDDLDVVQDSSSGNQSEPWLETGWTTDLLGATILSGGAYWTISGDAAA